MSQRERGKNKALRIDLGYYRRRSWLGIFRGIAIAIGLILSTLYGAWVLSLDREETELNDSGRAAHLSTGALALVHAHIENDCQSCHTDQFGVALAHDAWQRLPEQRLNLQEQKCNACHKVDGHARAMLAHSELDRDCARCHRDHQGRTHLLANVPSETCTECHRDLKATCKAGFEPKLLSAVTDFSTGSHGIAATNSEFKRKQTTATTAAGEESQSKQPQEKTASSQQFRSLLSDRGRVRFDHAQHLQPGQVDASNRGGFQLSMLSAELRAVYAKPGQQENDPVQLDCSNCHEPSAVGGSTHASAVAREEGRFYAPIDFEQHCAACHQMSFAGQEPNSLPLPHVAHREEFAKLLSAKQVVAAPRQEVVMPSDQAAATDEAAENKQDEKSVETNSIEDERIEAAVSAVFKRCQQCHLEEDTQHEVIARALAGTLEPLVPQRWLKHGHFDHAAHKHITRCVYCHPMPTSSGEAHDHERVLIRGPDSCVGCHRPVNAQPPPEFATAAQRLKTLGQTDQPTWASAECTECHRYHWSRLEGRSQPGTSVLP